MKQANIFWGPALLTISLLILITRTILPRSGTITYGFAAYYTASRLVLEGRLSPELYNEVKFRAEVEHETFDQASDIYWANPPTTALMFVPLAFFPPLTARRLWTGLCVVALGLAIVLLTSVFSPRPFRINIFCFTTSVFLLSSPLAMNFDFGQVYIVILAVMALALFALDRRIDWLAGFCIALTLVFKASGIPLLILLAINGRWRLTAWALLDFTALTLATLPLIGITIWKTFLLQVVPNFFHDPVLAVTAYQTVYGFVYHLFVFHPTWNPAPLVDWPLAAAFAAPLISFCLMAAPGSITNRSSLPRTFSLGLLLSVILIPAAEQHHYVLLLPAFLLAFFHQKIERLPVLIAAALIVTPLPYTLMSLSHGWWAILAYPRFYGAIILFITLLISSWEPQPHPLMPDY